MKNLKVSRKLLVAFGILVIITVIIAVFGAVQLLTVDAEYSYVLEFPFSRYSVLRDIEVAMMDARRIASRTAYDMTDPDDPIGVINNQEAIFRSLWADLEGMIDRYRYLLDTDDRITPAQHAEFTAIANSFEAGMNNYFENNVMRLMDAARAGDDDEVRRLVGAGGAMVDAALSYHTTLYTGAQNTMATVGGELTAQSLQTVIILIAISVAAVGIAVFLGIYVSRLFSKPLNDIAAFMEKASSTGDLSLSEKDEQNISVIGGYKDEIGRTMKGVGAFIAQMTTMAEELAVIASGDLTREITPLSDKDTMGNAMQNMLGNLNAMFGEINNATTQVSAGSKQIADGSQSLAQGSTEQASSVQQLSSSIAEIAQKTKGNAENAGKAAELANNIKGSAEKGNRQMDEMMTAVKDINASSQNIGKVIKSIDDIAFQTNILALNAAVEAARAGQHGKGFAVVAEEVRNLAAKSAAAAKDTESLIADSIEKAELGSKIADDTAASLVEIVAGIGESSQLVSEIARSSEEQSAGIAQINTGVDQVAQVTQQNSATAEESAAAAQEMSGQSDMLEQLISQFKLKDSGGSRSIAAGPTKELPAPTETASDGSFGKY